MTYVVQTLDEASNCDIDSSHKHFKYILNDIPTQPMAKDVLSKFNSITMPRAYDQYIESIWNLNVFEDDTWVISYPKCGTTW